MPAFRQALTDRHLGKAFSLIRELAPADSSSLTLEGEIWRGVASQFHDAYRTLRFLPDDPFLNELELEAARGGIAANPPLDDSGLLLWAHRFPSTNSARQVFVQLAVRDFDQGRNAAAAEGFRWLAAHPRVAPLDRRRAAAYEILSLAGGGRHEQAAERFARFREGMPLGGIDFSPANPSLAALWKARETRSRLSPEDAVHPNSTDGAAPPDLAFPSVIPAWRYQAMMPPEMAEMLRSSLEELTGQGIELIPMARPIVAGDAAVARILDDVVAFDLKTGDVRWRRSTGTLWKQLSGNLKMLQNDGLADLISRRLIYRLQGDSLYSRVGSDGRRVFALAEPDETSLISPSSPNGPRPNPASTAFAPFNQLVAWELDSGEERWRLGGPGMPKSEKTTKAESAENWHRGMQFLGTPYSLDGELFVIGSKDSELRLFVLSAYDGEKLWELTLAETSSEPATGDVRPLPAACPIVCHDGVLVCGTSSGALIAVDLFKRTPLWGRRYPRADVGLVGGPGGQAQWSKQLLFPWWKGWRETTLLARDGVLVFGGPDTDSVHALNLRTGTSLWTAAGEAGQQLLTVSQAGVLITNPESLDCLDLQTGQRRWSCAIGPIHGRPAVGRTTSLVPLADGSVAEVRLTDGVLVRQGHWGQEPLGNLSAFPGGFLAQDSHRLVRLQPLSERFAQLEKLPAEENAGLPLSQQRGPLLMEAGRFEESLAAAESAMKPKPTTDSSRRLRDTALAAMTSEPQNAERHWLRLEPVLTNAEERVAALELLGHAAAKNGTPRDAIRHWLRALEQQPTGEWSNETSFARRVRTLADAERESRSPARVRSDRRIQGLLIDLLSRDDGGGQDLPGELDQRLRETLASTDPFALQRFADQLSGLTWGRIVRLREPVKVGLGTPFPKTQLGLLELAQSTDRKIAATALRQSAKLHEDRGWRLDAAAAYRRLKSEYAGTILEEGRTGADVVGGIASDSLLGKLITEDASDVWPAKSPIVTRQAEAGKEVEMQPIPVTADSQSLLDRISVSIDRNGRKVRFTGGQQTAAWEVTLPGSKSMFRTAQPLHRGWAWGHLLLLRVGTELFGIVPLDERGDPNATVVWRLDMLEGQTHRWNQLGVKLDPAPPGFGLDDVVLVDRFGSELGQVGPVLPGYFCYRDQARLIAVETATGAKLWELHNLAASAVFAGNSELLLCGLPGESEAKVYRALDGRLVRTQRTPFPMEHVLAWHGSRAVGRTSESRLVAADFAEGRTIWERSLSAGSRPFAVDDTTLGVLEADGVVSLIELATGTTQNVVRVEAPAKIERIYSTCDEARCYVAIGGPPASPENQRIQQERGGFRSPPVNGLLAAFNRRTSRLEWTMPLVDGSLPHDQPKECPFLFLQTMRKGQGEAATNLLQLIDKRTGVSLHDWSREQFLPEYILEPNVEQRRLELRQAGMTIRVQFDE